MNSIGHIGITLAVYAPFGAALVATDHPIAAAFLAIGMITTSQLPDVDQKLSRLLPFVKHRGLIHSVYFPLAVATVFTGFAYFLWSTAFAAYVPVQLHLLAVFALGTILGPLAHLLGDIITPRGLRPFAPISKRKLALGWVKASNQGANGAFFFVGLLLAAGGTLGQLLFL